MTGSAITVAFNKDQLDDALARIDSVISALAWAQEYFDHTTAANAAMHTDTMSPRPLPQRVTTAVSAACEVQRFLLGVARKTT